MSGGHWDYMQYQVCDFFQDVSNDTLRRFPKISQVHKDLGSILDDLWHDLDWDISGDTEIKDDEEFEKKFIEDLGKVINAKLVLKIYEVEEK